MGHSLLPQFSHHPKGEETLVVEGEGRWNGEIPVIAQRYWIPGVVLPCSGCRGIPCRRSMSWAVAVQEAQSAGSKPLGEQMPNKEWRGLSVSVPALYPDVQSPSEVWSQSELMGQLTSGLNLNKPVQQEHGQGD